MEKFAIDLDKVLDDFEIDEDANHSCAHYEKPQVEPLIPHPHPPQPHLVGLGAVGGWSEPVHDTIAGRVTPVEVRGPPDGHDSDSSASPICYLRSHVPSHDTVQNFEIKNTSHESFPNSSNLQPADKDISYIEPKSVNCLPVGPHEVPVGPHEVPLCQNAIVPENSIASSSQSNDESISHPDISNQGSVFNYCPLDIVPPAHTNRAKSVNYECQHPDILDVKQSANEKDELPLDPETGAEDIEVSGEQQDVNVQPLDIEIHNSSVVALVEHLPDIMTDSSTIERVGVTFQRQCSDTCDPAIVTENSLHTLYSSEPAIVQESQSASRIPELVNVHQSVEQSCSSHHDHSLDIASVSTVRCLPDVSYCAGLKTQIFGNEEPDSDQLRFDPSLDVSKEELYAEFQNLDEDEEAYGNYCDTRDHIRQPTNWLEMGNHMGDEEAVNVTRNKFWGMVEDEGRAVLEGKADLSEEMTVDEPHSDDADEHNSEHFQREEDVEDKICQTAHDISSESIEIDTVSSSSTLTEGESLSSDHQFLPALDSPSLGVPGVGSLDQEIEDFSGEDCAEDHSRSEVGTEVLEASSEVVGVVGAVAPFWIPDEEAANCQECGVKFTVIRRRHHCRGCGRVLCAPCCHFKAPLPYMDYKEARVCNTCLQHLTQASERQEEDLFSQQMVRHPNPNNPMEYCSRIPPQQQVGAEGTVSPPTVMVPVGVLKRDSSNTSNPIRGNKQVIFSDGIRPGGDLTEPSGVRPPPSCRRIGRVTRNVLHNMEADHKGDTHSGAGGSGTRCRNHPEWGFTPDARYLPSGGGMPPILIQAPSSKEYFFESNPNTSELEEKFQGDGPPVVFALQKNLTVLVKLVKLDCCVGLEVWNVATRGMCNVGQEELVVLLEVLPGESCPPSHLFAFFLTVYQQANKGNLVTELGHTIFTEPEGFLGSKDHGGFLYIRPTFQCLHKLVLPPTPYIVAVLIQKWETPWAKVFPLRLMLRLGAEFRYYPCPLVSNRNRKPVYCEIGHTIMNLLVDFRNYAYTVPMIQGFVIHMEDKKTTLHIPRNRYEQVWNALNNSNDHVLALGANFSPRSDSHLVTVEDDDGHYSTQAINIHNKPRKVTGASFIVFNGALKSSSGLRAKSSIVEDGLMVQIPGDLMLKLRDALRHMREFDIPCGPIGSTEPDELVCIRWEQDYKSFNIGIKSPIDDRPMDGIPSVKIHSGTDYISNEYLIRWTEVFIIQGETHTNSNEVNISRLSESLARASCVALTPHLELLYGPAPNRLGLRATAHQENVGYEAGMRGSRLLPTCMKELDAELIPIIHRAAANITEEPVVLELIFHILEQ